MVSVRDAREDSILNTPSYHWNKAAGQVLSISSTFSGTTQTLSSNLESSDPTNNLTSTTFAVGNAQLLVLGRFALTIDAVYASSSAITGTTEQGAALQAANLTQAIALLSEGSATGTAYSLRVASTLQSGDVLSVLSYSDFLRRLERVTVGDNQEAGTLQLTYVPQLLDFGSVQVPSMPGMWRLRTAEVQARTESYRLAGGSADRDGRQHTAKCAGLCR